MVIQKTNCKASFSGGSSQPCNKINKRLVLLIQVRSIVFLFCFFFSGKNGSELIMVSLACSSHKLFFTLLCYYITKHLIPGQGSVETSYLVLFSSESFCFTSLILRFMGKRITLSIFFCLNYCLNFPIDFFLPFALYRLFTVV